MARWQAQASACEPPPRLSCATQTFPSLYAGQCIRFSKDGKTAAIKVRYRNDWLWMTYRLKGAYRYCGQGAAKSPLLTVKRGRWSLSVPVLLHPKPTELIAQSRRVLSLDVGINTTATCAVIDDQGTVLHREFFRRRDKDREYRLMQHIRSAARQQTRHGSQLPAGFCANDHRRLKQLALNEAHQISRAIVNLALTQGCHGIVAEQLKGWRPSAGRKRTPMKARFHRWFHRLLVRLIEEKARAEGLRFLTVYARGTSLLAFDGSGKVTRRKDNYAEAIFASGKRYNADLNAAYNIAARGAVLLFHSPRRKSSGDGSGQKSQTMPGSPVTLSTLWALSAQQAG